MARKPGLVAGGCLPASPDELEVNGEGRPLVFLHGGGGNHLAWWQQVPHFRDRYQVITTDFPGFGLFAGKRPARTDPNVLLVNKATARGIVETTVGG